MNSSPQADQNNELEGTDIYGTEMLELESYEQGEDFCDYDGMDDSDSEWRFDSASFLALTASPLVLNVPSPSLTQLQQRRADHVPLLLLKKTPVTPVELFFLVPALNMLSLFEISRRLLALLSSLSLFMWSIIPK